MKIRSAAVVMTLAISVFISGACDQGSGDDNPGRPASSLFISKSILPPGDTCPAGGVQIDMGFDVNMNNVLDQEEITNTEYVCNGIDSFSHPFVVYTNPSNNNTNVKRNQPITVVFSTDMDPDTINDSTFTVIDESDDQVEGTITYDNSVAVFTPAARLTGETYTATLDSSIESSLGVVMGYDHVISFSMEADAGIKATFTANDIGFKMVYVPGGQTFPTGTDDQGTAEIDDPFWIGETVVTYELWSTVYEWAVNGTGPATGEGEYFFSNVGQRGGYSNIDNVGYASGHETHPVTKINWRDAIVWCNALTEWYNAQNGTSYKCMYYSDSEYTTPIRTSTDSTTITWESGTGPNDGTQDDPYVDSNADGFRLLSSNEWECAARYIDGTIWLDGDQVSGDQSGACYDDGSMLSGVLSTVFGNYALYHGNSGSSTAEVKSKNANALGLYDMSGNIWEWSYDWQPTHIGQCRILRGGSWADNASGIRIGYNNYHYPYTEVTFSGIRLAKSAD